MMVRRMCSAGGAAVGCEWSREIAGTRRVVAALIRVAGFAACDEDSTYASISCGIEWMMRAWEYSGDVRVLIRMDASVFQFWSDLRHQHLDLFCFPCQHPCQKPNADTLKPLDVRQQLEFTGLLECLVLGPWIRGTFENYLADVGESSFLEPMNVVSIAGDRTIVFGSGFGDEVGPVGKVV